MWQQRDDLWQRQKDSDPYSVMLLQPLLIDTLLRTPFADQYLKTTRAGLAHSDYASTDTIPTSSIHTTAQSSTGTTSTNAQHTQGSNSSPAQK